MFKFNVICRYCSKNDAIKKYGVSYSGRQRYLCGHCNRTFQLVYASEYKNVCEVKLK
ncbi:transposase-like zinc-binding domain-containing protein [Leminorella richardii]|uniref:IS1/IS1595 family N-terminal zinc-binding domain-containing protein n=1 Tax=Leminorella richardii TaxID=158841 RepID=UPI0039EAD03D